jgi:AcrR family transcriptional regulator
MRASRTALRPVGRPPMAEAADVRRALLDAAAVMLGEIDINEFSLRECARRAGVSHGAPAHHFIGKTGLLTELAAESFDALGRAIDRRLLKSPADDAARFRAAATAYIEYAVHNKAQFQLMYRADMIDQQSPRLRAAFEACYRRIYGSMTVLLGSNARRLDERAVARFAMAWSTIHGFAILALDGDFGTLGEFRGRDATHGVRHILTLASDVIDEVVVTLTR